ncbi:MAG: hypothetical protein ACFFC6_01455 [Promethearchaeota archaeon]
METTILHSQDPYLNASLKLILFSPIFLKDYELKEDSLYCYFTKSISHLQAIIKTFLDALYEITSKQFYFEIINDREAILRIYGVDQLQFSTDVLYKSPISSQGRSKL